MLPCRLTCLLLTGLGPCAVLRFAVLRAGAGPAPGAGGGGGAGGGVHLMSEEQYLLYCERYMHKMGMPFDPDMVRQHYRRMREAAGL